MVVVTNRDVAAYYFDLGSNCEGCRFALLGLQNRAHTIASCFRIFSLANSTKTSIVKTKHQPGGTRLLPTNTATQSSVVITQLYNALDFVVPPKMSGDRVGILLSDSLASLKSTEELCSTMDGANDLPPVFHGVTQWVGLVQQIFHGAQNQLREGNLDTDDFLVDTLEDSKKKTRLLEGILKDVAPSAEALRLVRYQDAVRKQGKDRLEVVLLGLLEDTSELIEDQLISATDEQVKALCEAIEGLSTMEPSVPEDRQATFFHSGSGDMISNTSSGTQNIYKGRGTQNIARNIRVGR